MSNERGQQHETSSSVGLADTQSASADQAPAAIVERAATMRNDHRDPERRLLGETMRRKRERNEAREELARMSALVVDLQMELIKSRVRGRLLRFEDFHRYIGVHTVVDAEGHIDFRRLELLLSDLLFRSPELAAPLPDDIDKAG